MKKYNEQTLLESIKSLRETMAIVEGPFDAIAKPVISKAAEYIKPTFNSAKEYAGNLKTGFETPSFAKWSPDDNSAAMQAVRTGAAAKDALNNPNLRAAVTAGGAGAATLGTAAMYGDKAEHPEKGTPQDMSTHGSGYLDDNNPGYEYHPADDDFNSAIAMITAETGLSAEDAGNALVDQINLGKTTDPIENAKNAIAAVSITGTEATPAGAAAQATPPEAIPAANKTSHNWKAIYDLNKQQIGNNPNKIYPGQQLKMPNGSTYTVKPGDNLWKISQMQQPPVPPAAPGMPGLAKKKPPVQESTDHVSFGNDDSLARIIQLVKW